MRFHWLLTFAHILVSALALAQTPPDKPKDVPAAAPPPALPAGLTISDPAYPLPPEEHSKFRDLQHQIDQLEIEIQKCQVRIELDKSSQLAVYEKEQALLSKFTESKKINLHDYHLDPAELKFVPNEKPVKP